MKHKLKIITLLTLGTLSATVMAQAPNQSAPVQTSVVTSGTGTKIEVPNQPAVNDYSHIGEGNAYEKAVTPLLREISRKKSILELKKLDKEIAKLDEVEKKEQSGFVPMPAVQSAQTMKAMAPTPAVEEVVSTPVKVLMTYGAEDDLYAKIAVGDQGGYTVRKGDILPDGRTVLKVSTNFIEVQKAAKAKAKSKTEKIFVSAGTPTTPTPTAPNGLGNTGGIGGTNNSNMTFTQMPSANMPTLMPIPATNTSTATNVPVR